MVRKRLLAFALDYVIILLYIGLLIGVTLLLSHMFAFTLTAMGPAQGQLIGFTTLTLPVIGYFTLSEYSRYAGTIGKRTCGLVVVAADASKARLPQLLVRNLIKFLPWELAHFFVFQLFHSTRANQEPPAWVLAGLIAAQGMALLYLVSLVASKHKRSIYEGLSRTKVMYGTK